MSTLVRVSTIFAISLLTMTMALSPGALAGVATLAKGGLVEIIGYKQLTLNGNRGPVTVVVKGLKAKAIRTAIESSPSWNGTDGCLEETEPFIIRIVPRPGRAPTAVATAGDCDGQHLQVTVGKSTEYVTDSCALQLAVLADLPVGKANGTRQALRMAEQVCTASKLS